jgi:hypothetical protein
MYRGRKAVFRFRYDGQEHSQLEKDDHRCDEEENRAKIKKFHAACR